MCKGLGFSYLTSRDFFCFRSTCAYPSFYWGSYCSIVGFLCSVLQIMACSFLTIVLSVLLQFTASDYPIGLFNFCLVSYLIYIVICSIQLIPETCVSTLITKLPKVNDNHNICNATGATSGVGTFYPSGAPDFTPGFQWGSCYSIFSFICMFCRSLFVQLCFFLLTIVLSVLL